MKKHSIQKLSLLIFTILFVSSFVYSQDRSFLPKIKSATGKEKIDLMNDYAASFIRRNPSERLRISKDALAEARKINYKKGIAFSFK